MYAVLSVSSSVCVVFSRHARKTTGQKREHTALPQAKNADGVSRVNDVYK